MPAAESTDRSADEPSSASVAVPPTRRARGGRRQGRRVGRVMSMAARSRASRLKPSGLLLNVEPPRYGPMNPDLP